MADIASTPRDPICALRPLYSRLGRASPVFSLHVARRALFLCLRLPPGSILEAPGEAWETSCKVWAFFFFFMYVLIFVRIQSCVYICNPLTVATSPTNQPYRPTFTTTSGTSPRPTTRSPTCAESSSRRCRARSLASIAGRLKKAHSGKYRSPS